MVKFKQKILIAGILGLCLGFLGFQGVMAAGLSVQFENQPLFKEANFMPGDGVTRWIKVQNNDASNHKIIVETINETDADNFAKELNITIKKGSDVFYNKTLKEFFNQGEYVLEDLPGNGALAQYDFTISFKEAGGNELQGKTLGFDILIGFQGGEQTNGGEGGNSLTSLGGGGVVLPPGLTILDESVKVLTSEDQCLATIYWATTYLSTSQVIFDTVPGKFDLSFGPPNYGYAYSQEGDDSGQPKVTGHKVTLSGLIPGTTYYYRAISHASPDTISLQHSFVMCSCLAQENLGQVQENLPPEAQNLIAFNNNGTKNSLNTNTLGDSQGTAQPNEDLSAPTTTEQAKPDNSNFLANIASFFGKGFQCLSCLPWWIGIILVLLSIQKIAWFLRKAKKEQEALIKIKFRNSGIAWVLIGVASLAVTLILYFTKHCFYWWLVVIFFALHILIYQFLVPRKGEQRKGPNYFVIFQVIVLIVAVVLGIMKSCLWPWLILLIFVIIFINNKK